MFRELGQFLMRGNIIDLATGVIIGTAFNKIVDAVVTYFFMPIIGILTGGINLENMTFTLYGDSKIGWGMIVQSILHFCIIGFVLFTILSAYNRLVNHSEPPAPEVVPPTASEVMLADIKALMVKVEENTRK